MKKLFALILAIIMVFALAACGGGGSSGSGSGNTPSGGQGQANVNTPPPVQEAIEGEFFPGIKDEDIPEDLMRKAGTVVSAQKIPSNNADFSYEVEIVLEGAPMHFYSILSDHYNVRAESSELPLEEDQERYYFFDWGEIILSNKELLIDEGRIIIQAFII
ncbi:MAG: hypothetical protein FWD38_11455 [Oscillospiraceae bacterium]|nr:hypothetical protein [Oscillospiraceae bacterium]